MKGEEVTIKIGAWLMEQAAGKGSGIASDVDPRVHRNIKAMKAAEGQTAEMAESQCSACAKALGLEDDTEFQALFKIVHQLWSTGRLELMMEYWENRKMVDDLHA
ncbi:MAG: hypothetical protein ACI4NO_00880 [Oxalobacter sp.]